MLLKLVKVQDLEEFRNESALLSAIRDFLLGPHVVLYKQKTGQESFCPGTNHNAQSATSRRYRILGGVYEHERSQTNTCLNE